eukprot:tig00000076_g2434.t1
MQNSIRSGFSADGDSDDFIAEWAYNGGMFCAPKYGDPYHCQALDPRQPEYVAQLEEDPLFVASRAMRDDFIWITHTWSHEFMTTMGYDEAYKQLSYNIEFAKHLFGGSVGYKTHSAYGIVPRAFGWRAANVFRARQATGIVNAVQDQTTCLFSLDGTPTTLYEMWVRGTIEKVHRLYTGLPVKTLKQDDIFQLARERRAREFDCGFDGRLRAENGTWTGLLLSSRTDCRVPVTMEGLSPETLARYAGAVAVEKYGVDRTAWVNLKAGVPVFLQFASPIAL